MANNMNAAFMLERSNIVSDTLSAIEKKKSFIIREHKVTLFCVVTYCDHERFPNTFQ